MLEQDAVLIGCETGQHFCVKGLLETGAVAVVSFMPISTSIDKGFDRSELIQTYFKLAAAKRGAI